MSNLKMKDQNSVNNLKQNNDQLEPKPQSPIKIKEPEKLSREEISFQKNKGNSHKNKKSAIEDNIEHPEPLNSDYYDESIEEIKKNFFENKKKENLLIIEHKKNLKAKNIEIMQQKLKIEKDSKQLKENIGKVVLNSKYMNDKNIQKSNNKNKNSNLLIKPEKVVNNFELKRLSDIKKQNNLNNSNIIIKNEMKKNNSLKIIKYHKKQKLIKNNSKNQNSHLMGQIIKIPINLMAKGQQGIKQINKINQHKENDKTKNQQPSKSRDNKVNLKKIIKIVPMNDISTIEIERNKSPQTSVKKLNYNYINNIQNSQKKEVSPNSMNKNNNLNKIIISTKYQTLYQENSIPNKNKINLSYIKQDNIKTISSDIRKSDQISLNNDQNYEVKRIVLPFRVNNNTKNSQFYTISKEQINLSNTKNKINTSINNDFKHNSINKVNEIYNSSEIENFPTNLKNDKCNKKTIERGGKFNNNSTTYVVISKNTCSKLKKNLQPSRTIDTQNFQNQSKNLIPNLSSLSFQHSPLNKSPVQSNSFYPQKIPLNQPKTNKNTKSQPFLLNGKKNKSFSFQNGNNNTIHQNINYNNNYNLFGRNDLNLGSIKKIYYTKNKVINRPIIYNYNYGNNFWSDESFFSYLNTSGYNY
jgi:hypothetical protein